MPRNSLRNLDAIDEQPSAPAPGRGVPRRDLGDVADLPEALAALLGERRQLEERMAALTGDAGAPTTSDPRFPVTPLAERRRQDADWAQRRDRVATPFDRPAEPGSTTLDRFVGDAVDTIAEPPERTGQRVVRAAGRALRDPSRPRSDPSRRQSDPSRPRSDPSRRQSDPSRPLSDLSLKRLANDPDLREFGRDLAEPQLRPLRSLDETLRRARQRLDILEGGSGDLDHLRSTAIGRLADRVDEAARDRRRDDARTDRSRRDEERDMARLDRRGSADV